MKKKTLDLKSLKDIINIDSLDIKKHSILIASVNKHGITYPNGYERVNEDGKVERWYPLSNGDYHTTVGVFSRKKPIDNKIVMNYIKGGEDYSEKRRTIVMKRKSIIKPIEDRKYVFFLESLDKALIKTMSLQHSEEPLKKTLEESFS